MIDYSQLGFYTGELVLLDMSVRQKEKYLAPAALLNYGKELVVSDGSSGEDFDQHFKALSDIHQYIVMYDALVNGHTARTYKVVIKSNENIVTKCIVVFVAYLFKENSDLDEKLRFYNTGTISKEGCSQEDLISFFQGYSDAFDAEKNKEIVAYFDSHFLGKFE